MRYIALIHKEEGSDFGVSFPDLPGCVTAGRTVDEAMRLAAEALAFHVEGMREDGEHIPAPRDADAVRASVDVADAVLAYVPLIEDRGRARRVNVSIDQGLLEAIDEAARMRNLTRSAFLASAARRELIAD